MRDKKGKLFIVGIFILTTGILFLTGCEERYPTEPQETERPEVIATTPSNEVAGVPVDASYSIIFSEPMDDSSMVDTLFTLVNSSGDPVSGSLNWSNDSTLVFTPSADFDSLKAYTAAILGAFSENDNWKGPSVIDKNGNSLKYDYVTTFITEGNYGASPIYLSCSPNLGDPTTIGCISNFQLHTLGGFNLPMGIALTPDGSYLYVANRDGNSVAVVETSSFSINTEIEEFFGEETWIVGIKPDGTEAWVLNRALPVGISVIDVASNTVTHTIDLTSYCPEGGFPYRMTFTNDGSKAYVTTRLSKSVLKINTDTYTVQREKVIDDAEHISEVAVSLDDEKVYVSNTWGLEPSIYVLDAHADMPVITTIDLTEEWGDSKKFTTFGNYLYVGMRWDAMIYKIDMTTDEIIAWTGWPDDWFGDWSDGENIAVDPSGEVIYMLCPDRGKIALFDSELNYVGDIDSEGSWWGIVAQPGKGIQ